MVPSNNSFDPEYRPHYTYSSTAVAPMLSGSPISSFFFTGCAQITATRIGSVLRMRHSHTLREALDTTIVRHSWPSLPNCCCSCGCMLLSGSAYRRSAVELILLLLILVEHTHRCVFNAPSCCIKPSFREWFEPAREGHCVELRIDRPLLCALVRCEEFPDLLGLLSAAYHYYCSIVFPVFTVKM